MFRPNDYAVALNGMIIEQNMEQSLAIKVFDTFSYQWPGVKRLIDGFKTRGEWEEYQKKRLDLKEISGTLTMFRTSNPLTNHRKTYIKPNLSLDIHEAHTALCMWEWHIEQESRDNNDLPLHKYRESHGAAGTRELVAELAPMVERVWLELTEGTFFCFSYDWDFIPSLMESLSYEDLIHPNHEIYKELASQIVKELSDEYNQKG